MSVQKIASYFVGVRFGFDLAANADTTMKLQKSNRTIVEAQGANVMYTHSRKCNK